MHRKPSRTVPATTLALGTKSKKKLIRIISALHKWGTEATQVTRLTQCLTGSSAKIPVQWEEVENKNKTERIRLHIEGTERSMVSFIPAL